MIEVFGIAFAIMGLLPSIASTLTYSIAAGPVGLVWGWFLASGFIFVVGLAMADLGSAMPTSGGLYWWTHFFASPQSRNALSFLVGYSNTLGLVGGLCSIDYDFSLMFLSVIVIARDGNWTPSNGAVYGVFLACVLCHGILASSLSKIMGKLQIVFVVMNFVLILATILALPIGRATRGLPRNDASYIFGQTANLSTWPTGWAFMLSWMSPIWTIGAFDSCVHMSEEAANASRAVPYGILMSIGSCWLFGFICCIVIAACMSQDLDSILSSPFGQPMAQIYYDAVGKHGTLALMSLLFIVQFLMGLSITVAASRQTWLVQTDLWRSCKSDTSQGLQQRRCSPIQQFLPSHQQEARLHPIPRRLGLRLPRRRPRPPVPHRTSSSPGPVLSISRRQQRRMARADLVPCGLGPKEIQAWSVLHWSFQHPNRMDQRRVPGLWHRVERDACGRPKPIGRGHELCYRG